MVAAEMTDESATLPREIVEAKVVTRTSRKRFAVRRAKSAANGDFVTFPGLKTITAVLWACASDGTLGTWTIATNKLTITNSGTLVWSAEVEGVRGD